MAEKDLQAEREFIKTNKDRLLTEYRNKFILVSNQEVIGSFDTYERAAEEGVRLYGPDGRFLVHHLMNGEPLNFIMGAGL